MLELAWVHDSINGALNSFHVVAKALVQPLPRTPEEDNSEEEEAVQMEDKEEQMIEEAEDKARERQEWDRIRGELQEARAWEMKA